MRAGGEGPWGVGRSSRTRAGDGGVRLRQRSCSRRNGDGAGRSEGGVGNPRDRYSAPPTDRQFPPHSCTSATYQHGCCGTSRITLRLSKNGSTLEIEKCDFNNSLKSCQHCGHVAEAAAASDAESHRLDVLLRTQSAPNLSTIPSDNYSNPPPVPPRHASRQAVESETQPPPLPPRDFGGFGRLVLAVEDMDSRPGSVETPTRVDIDVESLCSSRLSSFDHGLHGSINVYGESTMPSNESEYTAAAHDLTEIHTYHQNERYGLRNSTFSARAENFPSGDAQNVNMSILCPYDKSINYARTQQSKTSLPNHHIVTGAVDLTAFYSTNADMFSKDFDVDCPSGRNWRLLRHNWAGDAAHKGMGLAGAEHFSSGKHCHGDRAVISAAASLHHDVDKSAIANGASECCQDNRVFTHGATDYRVRMLGAGGGEVMSHVAEIKGADHSYMSTALKHTHSQIMPCASGSRLTVGASANDSQVKSGAYEYDSPMRLSANGMSCHPMTAGVSDSQMVASSAGVMGAVSRWDHHSDESTDTGCESDEDGDRSKLLARLEMAPAYVHADFKNGEIIIAV